MARKDLMLKSSLVFIIAGCLFCSNAIFAEETVLPKKARIASARASSGDGEFAAEKAIDGDLKTRWSSDFSDPQWFMLDLGEKVTVDKLVLYWEAAYAKIYEIQVSEDGRIWYTVYRATTGKEGKTEISFKPVSARYIRVYCFERGTGWGYSLFEAEVGLSAGKPVSITEFKKFDNTAVLEQAKPTPRTYYSIVSEMAPPGYYPKWLSKKQNFWNLVGTKDSFNESLLCEDGTIEPFNKSFSFMPYLYLDKKLVTAADAKITVSLEDGYMPIPGVTWVYNDLVFSQKLFAYGGYDNSATYVWYQLENKSVNDVNGKLFLTIRPFQANPPWMSGGFTDIISIEEGGDKKIIRVNGRDGILSLAQPDNFGAIDYFEGDIIDSIKEGGLPPRREVYTPIGVCSAALEYRLSLKPAQKKDYLFVIPVDKGIDLATLTSEKDFFEKLKIASSQWKKDLNKIQIDIPDTDLINTLKSNLAYILINKDGAAVQPGSRNYKRTWMRDGAEIAVALMRTGHLQEAKEYIDWAAKRQVVFTGEVLPMINADGSAWDWGKTLKEYDSQGEFVYSVAEYYRFTRDEKFLRENFQAVVKALKFMEELRQKRMTDEFKSGPPEKRRFYGILPESVSHEGYAAPGMHSYWDDIWALKGWKDAQFIARVLGETKLIPWMEKEEKDFRDCFINSIKLTQQVKNIEYIPGCADLGDFDATATSIAVWPTEESQYLSKKELLYTLDKYYEETFMSRIKDGFKKEFTPYEIRNATAYLLLGEKEKSLKMLNWFLTTRRPTAWNHWGEVVWPDYYEPKYLGDMPHSWEGAIYINAVRNLFAYELNDDLFLGAGIDEQWLSSEKGVSVTDLPNHFGDISYTVQREGDSVKIKVWGKVNYPPRNFIFSFPLKNKIKKAVLNGKNWTGLKGEQIIFDKLPAEIIIKY